MRTRSMLLLAALVAAVSPPTGHGAAAHTEPDATAVPTAATAPSISPATAPTIDASAADVDLCASTGTISLPGITDPVPVWGFVATSSCTTGLVDATNFPGPTIRATAGSTVTINLTNALSVNTSILVPGQTLTTTGGSNGTFAVEAAANGGTATYQIDAAAAGTYLYESGTDADVQIPMGLYGALVIDAAPGQAYGSATAYDVDAVLLLSEIDPDLNAAPAAFDLLTYHPTYWLINGEVYPNTATITAAPGDRVLLRYLNAGFDNPSMALLGAYQEVVAKQSDELTNRYQAIAEIIPAGSTADLLVDTTGLEGPLPLYNRNGYVVNGDSSPGGMLMFLDVQPPVGAVPTVGVSAPPQSATVFGDAVSVQIDADDSEDTTPCASPPVQPCLLVEWNVDGGPWQQATWTAGTSYEATWDTTLGGDGVHMIGARATDSDGNVAADSRDVIVSNQPAVAVVAPAEGASITGDTVLVQIDATDAEDAAGTLDVGWGVDGDTSLTATWNGGSGFYEAVLDSTALADGAHTIDAVATDSRAISSAPDDNAVTVSNLPSVAIVSPADGDTVSGTVTIQIDADDLEDQTPCDSPPVQPCLLVEWSVDGGSPAIAIWNPATGYYEATWTTPSPPSSATIDASATDSRGNVATDSLGVTVGINSIHVGDLDGTSTPGGGPNWTATVTATIHDVLEQPVPGATVEIESSVTRKSNGTVATSILTCVTGAGGTCDVARSVNSNNFEDQATFTVTGVTDSAPYDPALDHDPDGDSDGTAIVVPR